MIFRNDDISKFTKLSEFKMCNEILKKYNITHTIAVLTNGIASHTELLKYINDNKNISVQVHGHDHLDFTNLSEDELHQQFSTAKKTLNDLGFNPDMWYPPWNRSNYIIEGIAEQYGLKTSFVKCSLEYYIKHNGKTQYDTINFHSWYEPEQMQLEAAAIIHSKNK